MSKHKKLKKKEETVETVVMENKVSAVFADWKIALLCFFFGFLLYVNSIPNDYAVDDTIIITQNQFTQQGVSGIEKIMTTDAFVGFFGERGKTLVAGGRYRPLSIVSFALENQIFGTNKPHISHFINALLYGLTGFVLYLLLCFIIPSKESLWWTGMAFLVTLLYLSHPLHTEAVANIKGRDEMMGFFFSVLSLYLILLSNQTKKKLYAILSFVAFFLALLSKENAITFLAIIPLSLWVSTQLKLKEIALKTLPYIGLTLIFLFLRNKFTGSSIAGGSTELMNDPFAFSTTLERYGTVFYSWLMYLKLLLFPYPLTHDYYPYQVPKVSVFNLFALLSIVLNVGLGIYGLMRLKKDKHDLIGYGILFYFITFSIVSQLFFTVGTNMSERFMYMPSLGFAIVLVALLHLLIKDHKKMAYMVFVLCGVFSVLTVMRNPVWKNDYKLFATDVKTSVNSAKLNMAYGGELITQANMLKDSIQKSKMYAEAIEHLTKSIAIYKDTTVVIDGKSIEVGYANAYNLLGNAYYFYNKDLDKAERAYIRATQIRPGHFDGFQNLVTIYNERKQYQKSVPLLYSLISNQPNNAVFYYKMGDAFKNMMQADSAVKYYDLAAKFDPKLSADCQYQLGSMYGKLMNRLDRALPYLQKAVELDPNISTYQEDYGVALAMAGQTRKAIDVFAAIIQKNPNYLNVQKNISAAYQSIGMTDSAQYHAQQAFNLMNPK